MIQFGALALRPVDSWSPSASITCGPAVDGAVLGSVEVGDEMAVKFRRAVRVGPAQVSRVPGPRYSTAQRPGRELLEFCRDREADVLRFCSDTRIWPTNNLSERDLRPTTTQQKISGRLTSEEITQDRLDIRSYIDTARKQGINIMTALRQAITGNPWWPPGLTTA